MTGVLKVFHPQFPTHSMVGKPYSCYLLCPILIHRWVILPCRQDNSTSMETQKRNQAKTNETRPALTDITTSVVGEDGCREEEQEDAADQCLQYGNGEMQTMQKPVSSSVGSRKRKMGLFTNVDNTSKPLAKVACISENKEGELSQRRTRYDETAHLMYRDGQSVESYPTGSQLYVGHAHSSIPTLSFSDLPLSSLSKNNHNSNLQVVPPMITPTDLVTGANPVNKRSKIERLLFKCYHCNLLYDSLESCNRHLQEVQRNEPQCKITPVILPAQFVRSANGGVFATKSHVLQDQHRTGVEGIGSSQLSETEKFQYYTSPRGMATQLINLQSPSAIRREDRWRHKQKKRTKSKSIQGEIPRKHVHKHTHSHEKNYRRGKCRCAHVTKRCRIHDGVGELNAGQQKTQPISRPWIPDLVPKTHVPASRNSTDLPSKPIIPLSTVTTASYLNTNQQKAQPASRPWKMMSTSDDQKTKPKANKSFIIPSIGNIDEFIQPSKPTFSIPALVPEKPVTASRNSTDVSSKPIISLPKVTTVSNMTTSQQKAQPPSSSWKMMSMSDDQNTKPKSNKSFIIPSMGNMDAFIQPSKPMFNFPPFVPVPASRNSTDLPSKPTISLPPVTKVSASRNSFEDDCQIQEMADHVNYSYACQPNKHDNGQMTPANDTANKELSLRPDKEQMQVIGEASISGIIPIGTCKAGEIIVSRPNEEGKDTKTALKTDGNPTNPAFMWRDARPDFDSQSRASDTECEFVKITPLQMDEEQRSEVDSGQCSSRSSSKVEPSTGGEKNNISESTKSKKSQIGDYLNLIVNGEDNENSESANDTVQLQPIPNPAADGEQLPGDLLDDGTVATSNDQTYSWAGDTTNVPTETSGSSNALPADSDECNTSSETFDKFKCIICDNSYTLRHSLISHIRRQHINFITTAHQCKVCQKWFKTTAAANKHMTSVHAASPSQLIPKVVKFTCRFCGVVFKTRYELIYHERTDHAHQHGRCFYCDTMFANRINLENHIALHHQSCCRYCPLLGPNEGIIDTHERTQHPEEYILREIVRKRANDVKRAKAKYQEIFKKKLNRKRKNWQKSTTTKVRQDQIDSDEASESHTSDPVIESDHSVEECIDFTADLSSQESQIDHNAEDKNNNSCSTGAQLTSVKMSHEQPSGKISNNSESDKKNDTCSTGAISTSVKTSCEHPSGKHTEKQILQEKVNQSQPLMQKLHLENPTPATHTQRQSDSQSVLLQDKQPIASSSQAKTPASTVGHQGNPSISQPFQVSQPQPVFVSSTTVPQLIPSNPMYLIPVEMLRSNNPVQLQNMLLRGGIPLQVLPTQNCAPLTLQPVNTQGAFIRQPLAPLTLQPVNTPGAYIRQPLALPVTNITTLTQVPQPVVIHPTTSLSLNMSTTANCPTLSGPSSKLLKNIYHQGMHQTARQPLELLKRADQGQEVKTTQRPLSQLLSKVNQGVDSNNTITQVQQKVQAVGHVGRESSQLPKSSSQPLKKVNPQDNQRQPVQQQVKVINQQVNTTQAVAETPQNSNPKLDMAQGHFTQMLKTASESHRGKQGLVIDSIQKQLSAEPSQSNVTQGLHSNQTTTPTGNKVKQNVKTAERESSQTLKVSSWLSKLDSGAGLTKRSHSQQEAKVRQQRTSTSQATGELQQKVDQNIARRQILKLQASSPLKAVESQVQASLIQRQSSQQQMKMSPQLTTTTKYVGKTPKQVNETIDMAPNQSFQMAKTMLQQQPKRDDPRMNNQTQNSQQTMDVNKNADCLPQAIRLILKKSAHVLDKLESLNTRSLILNKAEQDIKGQRYCLKLQQVGKGAVDILPELPSQSLVNENQDIGPSKLPSSELLKKTNGGIGPTQDLTQELKKENQRVRRAKWPPSQLIGKGSGGGVSLQLKKVDDKLEASHKSTVDGQQRVSNDVNQQHRLQLYQ